LTFAFAFRYSSLSAIAAAVLTPLYSFFLNGQIETSFFTAIALLVLIRHHANIKRLLNGTESKINFKKKA
jgi:glycerol-3-phosphate acyltransferase PlsY